jgi:hypothetical protein
VGTLGSSGYKVLMDGPGRIIYREANHEYLFPVFEEDGEIIIGGDPSKRRIHFFFGWYWHPTEFSKDERDRILPRLINHFTRAGSPARVFDRGDEDGRGFVFYPELFDARTQASEVLERAGFAWFSEYGSIDLLHEEYGLEVCGIHEEANVKRIADTMQAAFPQWHFAGVCQKDFGPEPGWKFRIHMLRRRCGGERWVNAD